MVAAEPPRYSADMTDPIADFLTRIRNSLKAHHHETLIPSSRFSRELARVLKEEGYIEDFSVEMMHYAGGRRRRRSSSQTEMIRVQLKYTDDRQPVISGLRRVSRPGRRRYVGVDELPRVLGGMGTAVITTSRGVMTANEAKRQRVGGEVVAFVW
jgi:small subunit ribosomal protein S8